MQLFLTTYCILFMLNYTNTSEDPQETYREGIFHHLCFFAFPSLLSQSSLFFLPHPFFQFSLLPLLPPPLLYKFSLLFLSHCLLSPFPHCCAMAQSLSAAVTGPSDFIFVVINPPYILFKDFIFLANLGRGYPSLQKNLGKWGPDLQI